MSASVGRRDPCLIGVSARTWRGLAAPEPLDMWSEVVVAAVEDTGASADLSREVDSLDVVYCQTTQYDDAPRRLADRLGLAPQRLYYSGIGGTTPQQLVNAAAERILQGETDLAVVTSAEALATQRALKAQGERPQYSYRPDERRPFPYEAPFIPTEIAHDVFQAWLTFALFDNARRARTGMGMEAYRRGLGEMLAPMTRIAAGNPHAWFQVERSVDEIVDARPENRMVGYPYTKYMVAVMDVDMAAALVIASDETADRLGVPIEQRVYLRGWSYATDEIYVAEHADLTRSPAMEGVARAALSTAGVQTDELVHLDLYSCFGASLHFACDALGIETLGGRPLTVTGGLPYHGGPASGYMTHSIAQMAHALRSDPGSFGLTTGVGMHNTKHVMGVWSTSRGAEVPTPCEPVIERQPACTIVDEHQGRARVATYSVVHGRAGAPEWALLVCDLGEGRRCYARLDDPDALREAERTELIGRTVGLVTVTVDGPTGEVRRNLATV